MPAKSVDLAWKRSAHTATAAGVSRLIVESKAFFAIPLLIPVRRFRVRCFFGLELVCTIPLGQFSLRLQPILKVITEQPAAGTTDLVGTVQYLFDPRSLVDCCLVKDLALRFNCFSDFVVGWHVQNTFRSQHTLLPLC